MTQNTRLQQVMVMMSERSIRGFNNYVPTPSVRALFQKLGLVAPVG